MRRASHFSQAEPAEPERTGAGSVVVVVGGEVASSVIGAPIGRYHGVHAGSRSARRGGPVGIDAGMTSLVTPSTGEKITNPRHERVDRKRLARAQRALTRTTRGSNNREKARRKVARVHARITDRRRDHLHTLSTRLVRENQAVVIEDLQVANMLGNHSLARAISDAAWRELPGMVEYKCRWYGRDLVVVDRWFPSSKACSA